MRQIRIEVVEQAADAYNLRLYDSDDKLVDERPLDQSHLEAILEQAEETYQLASAAELSALGAELYGFLDGETHRWLGRARNKSRKSLTLRIDVAQRLSHLPWELLRDDGIALCALGKGGWLPVRQVGREKDPRDAQNRPLRLLLMACDPIGGDPSLSYEAEEARILEATRRPQIDLEVEESGWLGGLEECVEDFGADYFDTFHITGHAQMTTNGPVFVMETDEGLPQLVTPEKLQDVFGDPWPRLLFLSGCETGKSQDAGALPSFCEALVHSGAPAVLGWALPVFDDIASRAAAELYGELARGQSIADAVLATRGALYRFEQEKQQIGRQDNWHLLRLYTDGTELGPLVTPLRTPDRKVLAIRPAQQEFLDAHAKSEVCPRERFVGRRRKTQRGLQVLRTRPGDTNYAEGLLIYGMGGLGKSSLAARLCDRMRLRRLVIAGHLDAEGLQSKLLEMSKDAATNQKLQDERLDFSARLEIILEGPLQIDPVLFVFDDFEQNLEREASKAPRLGAEGRAVLCPEPAATLVALLQAIRRTAAESRVIVTCRYNFALPGPARLEPLTLEHFAGADLRKKLAQLDAFEASKGASAKLRQRIIDLAGGNPRLLERLDRVTADVTTDASYILKAMEGVAETFREETLLRVLIEHQPQEARRLLASLSLLRLPVEVSTVEVLQEEYPGEDTLERSIALGLLERAKKIGEEAPTYFVTSVLDPLLDGQISPTEARSAEARVCRRLDAIWQAGRFFQEHQSLEILRLALSAKERSVAAKTCARLAHGWFNQSRFLEAVQLCQKVSNEIGDDYRILMARARSEEILGQTQEALVNYEKALDISPSIAERTLEDSATVSATLSNLAQIVAQQGNLPKAKRLLEESLRILDSIGLTIEKSSVLNNMAQFAALQGDIPRAKKLLEESLVILEKNQYPRGRAAILHQMANIAIEERDYPKAQKFWEESLNIERTIGNSSGFAMTLQNVAFALAHQGDFPKAKRAWESSFQVFKDTGNARGMGSTLANMAWAAGLEGDKSRETELNLEAARLLGQTRAFSDLITVAGNLGSNDGQEQYLAQALWLSARIQAPMTKILNYSSDMVQRLGPAAELSVPIAATALYLVRSQARNHHQFKQLQHRAISLLGACAQKRQIAPEGLQDWMTDEGLLDPAQFLPRFFDGLEALIGDDWLFTPSLF